MRETVQLSPGTDGKLEPIFHQPDEPNNAVEESTDCSDGKIAGKTKEPGVINWPQGINQKFMEEAYNNIGKGIDKTWAFLCGYKDANGEIHATTLVFPKQFNHNIFRRGELSLFLIMVCI